MFNRFLFISFISFFSGIILTMNACQNTPQDHRQNTSTSNGAPQDTLAQANLTAGLPQQVQRHLALAAGLLEKKDYAAATAALQPLQRQLGNPASDAASWRDDYARLLAHTARGTQNFSAAQTALAMLDQWTAADYLLSADICEALQDYRCSADGYIQATLELGLAHPELPAQINETIWQNLNSAGQGPARFTHRYHHAWWLLQQQIRAAGSVPAQQVAWRAWQQRYPEHPASLQPPQILQRLDSYRAPRIALFLPLSGPLESAGTAVRDGLISAFLSEQYNNKPSIRVYDTTAGDIASLWEQALLDGAEVSVGPLLKENVERFSRLTEFASQPRLVLNYLDGAAAASTTPAAAPSATPAATPDATTSTTPSASTTATPPATPPATTAATTTEEPAATSVDKLFQFGIAIEDEARSLAKHVLLDGHQRLLIVYSGSRWSRRAYNEYLAQWPYPATSAEFVDIKGLTEVVGEAMQVAASQERKQEIANILGQPLEFVARARQDMDAVVAFVSQLEARALSPALAFHFASNLPIYATSQVARGGHLAELDGFKLTEMPLFAEPNDNQAALDNAFALHSNAQAELFALGFDAYRLATWLQLQRLQLQRLPLQMPLQTPYDQFALPTASGLLRLDNRGKFKRELSLRQVGKDGQLQEPAAN